METEHGAPASGAMQSRADGGAGGRESAASGLTSGPVAAPAASGGGSCGESDGSEDVVFFGTHVAADHVVWSANPALLPLSEPPLGPCDAPPMPQAELRRWARLASAALRRADAVFVTAGAGCSAEAGIPTYRGGTDMYAGGWDPDKIDFDAPSPSAHRSAWEWARSLAAHVLAARGAEAKGPYAALRSVLTALPPTARGGVLCSNIDGLMRRALGGVRCGARESRPLPIAELHGELCRLQHCNGAECSAGGPAVWTVGVEAIKAAPTDGIKCQHCGGRTRPTVSHPSDDPEGLRWPPTRAAALTAVRRAASRRARAKRKPAIVVLELGAGTSIHSVRREGELLVARGHPSSSVLLRVNPDGAPVPSSRTVAISAAAGAALEALASVMRESAEEGAAPS